MGSLERHVKVDRQPVSLEDGNWLVLLSSNYMVGLLHERNEHLIFRDHAND